MIPGVDTHKDVHVAAILTIAGILLAPHSFPTTRDGSAATLKWAHRFGDVNAASVECTGSYGFRADEVPPNQNVTVFEVNQPDRALRRTAGKRGIGAAEEPRQMRLVKSSAVKARTTAINQLSGLVVGAEPALRDELRGLSTKPSAGPAHCCCPAPSNEC